MGESDREKGGGGRGGGGRKGRGREGGGEGRRRRERMVRIGRRRKKPTRFTNMHRLGSSQ